MRIVVKPAGLILILVTICLLSVVAFLRQRPTPVAADAATPSSPRPVASQTDNLLKNASFEGDGLAPRASIPNPKGKASGKLGAGWMDNSDWADIQLDYQLDPSNPHAGENSQRIKIASLASGQAQFVQELDVKQGTRYRATIWARASKENVPVQLVLRQTGEPYTEYGSTVRAVGLQWQQITVTGTASQSGTMYLMTICRSPDTALWLDDAVLQQAR